MPPANVTALRLIKSGLPPVLLGSEGNGLKRPLLTGWQTAVYTAPDVSPWPPPDNGGMRCGLQRNGLAERIAWQQGQAGAGTC